ncbi:MAG TPA: hypothetical protein VJR89_25060, partial [Polyangiales bacterium]|nr:hypothetical protein [Polyangiales bacterium]
MTTTAEYDVSEAVTIFGAAHHERMREAYARDQVNAARSLCLCVLEAAAGRGFSVTPDGEHAWLISAARAKGSARVAISEYGDIQVSTRQHESPRAIKIRYDVVNKQFVGTDEQNAASALARTIVAAHDEGWQRDARS